MMRFWNRLIAITGTAMLLAACDDQQDVAEHDETSSQPDAIAQVELDGESYELVPSSQTAGRVESVLPGTTVIPDELRLRPPEVRFPDQIVSFEDDDRDYLPDPFAEFVVDVTLDRPMETIQLAVQLTPAVRDALGLPTFFGRDVDTGRWAFLTAADGPVRVDRLKLAYLLAADNWTGERPQDRLAAIQSGVAYLPRFLDKSGIGHSITPPPIDELPERFRIGQSISQLEGNYVATVLVPPEGRTFDGREVWTVLHSAGLPWGDMDHFHWPDPTDQTDYLFDIWADDGAYGYALPELIAKDEQDFISLTFAFNIARSPDPDHVYREMRRAVGFAHDRLGGTIAFLIDDQLVSGPEDHLAAIAGVTATLASHGLRPGQFSVLRLN